jgi:hypothetical protein
MPLPSLKGIAGSDSDRQKAKSTFSTMEEIEKTLQKRGFVVDETPPPVPMPKVTAEHLTTTNSREYTTMYAHQLAWLNYSTPLLAKVRAQALELNNRMKTIESQIRKDLKSKNRGLDRTERMSEQEIEDFIWLDPEYQELLVEKQKNDQQKGILEKIVEGMEANMKVISRQIEIRKLETGNHGIEHNMAGRGGTNPFKRG